MSARTGLSLLRIISLHLELPQANRPAECWRAQWPLCWVASLRGTGHCPSTVTEHLQEMMQHQGRAERPHRADEYLHIKPLCKLFLDFLWGTSFWVWSLGQAILVREEGLRFDPDLATTPRILSDAKQGVELGQVSAYSCVNSGN